MRNGVFRVFLRLFFMRFSDDGQTQNKIKQIKKTDQKTDQKRSKGEGKCTT